MDGTDEINGLTPTTYKVTDLPVALPAASKDGYTFTGWNTQADGKGFTVTAINGGPDGAPSGNITLYAQFEAIDVDVDVVVKSAVTGQELSNLNVAAKTVKYDSEYTFSLSQNDLIYALNDDVFAADEKQTITVTGADAATGKLTIEVTAYPATVAVEVKTAETYTDTYLTWSFSVDPAVVANGQTGTVTLTATANASFGKDRTVTYTVNGGTAETWTITADNSTTVFTQAVSIDASLKTAPITIEISDVVNQA